MAIKPVQVDFEGSAVGIMNAIRNDIGGDFKQTVPKAQNTTESLKLMGSAIMGFQPRKNEFVEALVNRIGKTIIENAVIYNRYEPFHRGFLEWGETYAEYFIDLARPYTYDLTEDDSKLLNREKANVLSSFYSINYQKYYKITVSDRELGLAFLSWDGMNRFISGLTNSVANAIIYDQYVTIKYALAYWALNGNINMVQIPDFMDKANSNAIVSIIREYSDNFATESAVYNLANVVNPVYKDDQYLFKTTKFGANIDVNSLAQAFNISYAEFLGHQLTVNGFAFSEYEQNRLKELNEKDETFDESVLTDERLNSIGAFLISKYFLNILDALDFTGTQYNALKMWYNEFTHDWKIIGLSPYHNAVAFTTEESAVTAVNVSPSTPTASKEDTIQFSASVSGTGFYNKAVTWSISGNTDANTTISNSGLLSIGADENGSTITVKATSVFTPSISGSTTVTIE